jgi:putative ATPase
LRDAHYQGAKGYGHGVGYIYTHDQPQTPQQFLPSALLEKRYVDNQPGQHVGKTSTNPQ